jgi:hypothetical protein
MLDYQMAGLAWILSSRFTGSGENFEGASIQWRRLYDSRWLKIESRLGQGPAVCGFAI